MTDRDPDLDNRKTDEQPPPRDYSSDRARQGDVALDTKPKQFGILGIGLVGLLILFILWWVIL